VSPALLALALLVPVSRAAPAVAATLASLSDARHACETALPALEARAPTDAAAAVERADCVYRLGRLDEARASLEALFAKGAAGRELAPHPLGEGLALLSILRARAGQADRAEGARLGIPPEDSGRGHRVRAVLAAADGRPAEAWPIVDEALSRWPRDPHAVRAAAEVASLDPDHVTPTAQAAIRRPADVVHHHNKAVIALVRGDGARCLVHVRAGLSVATEDELPRFHEVGYACAVSAGKVDEASRMMMARRSVAALSQEAVLQHGELLLDAGRAREAARLLRVLRLDDPALRADQGSLRIRAHVADDDLDGALSVARNGASHPGTRANLAVSLHKAGRSDEAAALLEPTCPELSGRAAKDCEELLGFLRR
jgi:tetratricopeptide (TPR) repeat protein